MIATQPVVYELERLKMPVLFLIGDKDTTGRSNRAPREVQMPLGNFPAMSKKPPRRAFPPRGWYGSRIWAHSPQNSGPGALSQGAAGRSR